MRSACRVNLTTKTACSLQNVTPSVDTPTPQAHDQRAHMTSAEAHQHNSLTGRTVSRTRSACKVNLTTKTGCSPQNVTPSVNTPTPPLAHDQHHSLTGMTVSRTRSACKANLTKKTGCSRQNVSIFPRTSKKCSSAGYAWKTCLRTLSLVPIHVDTPSVESACADTFLLASRNTDFPSYALLAPQVRVRVKAPRAVRRYSSPLVKALMDVVEVSQMLALNLGLTDKQFNIWTEMEMVSFSVRLHCRKYSTPMTRARVLTNL